MLVCWYVGVFACLLAGWRAGPGLLACLLALLAGRLAGRPSGFLPRLLALHVLLAVHALLAWLAWLAWRVLLAYFACFAYLLAYFAGLLRLHCLLARLLPSLPASLTACCFPVRLLGRHL